MRLNAHAPEILQDEEGNWHISRAQWPTFEQKPLYPTMEDKGLLLRKLADFSIDWQPMTGGTKDH